MTDLELFVAVCALLIVGVALFAIAYCAWEAGTWMWRSYRRKKARPGYVPLQPTPGRQRLGISEKSGRTAPTAGRLTQRK